MDYAQERANIGKIEAEKRFDALEPILDKVDGFDLNEVFCAYTGSGHGAFVGHLLNLLMDRKNARTKELWNALNILANGFTEQELIDRIGKKLVEEMFAL